MYQLNSYRSKFTSMWISWITSSMHWQNDRPGHGPITYHAFNPETCWLVIVYTTLISSLNDVGTQSMFRDRCNQRFSGGVFIVTFVIFNDRTYRLKACSHWTRKAHATRHAARGVAPEAASGAASIYHDACASAIATEPRLLYHGGWGGGRGRLDGYYLIPVAQNIEFNPNSSQKNQT